MERIKVYIVDDHEMFREGVKMLLAKSEEFEVIGEARDGRECIENIPSETEIVLMDISMPGMNGIEATQKLRDRAPESKIIALSMFGEEEYYYKMIHAGISGFVLKEAGSKEMEEAIRIVYQGGNFFSNELLRNVVVGLNDRSKSTVHSQKPEVNLTEAEAQVLEQVCAGYTDEEIAENLSLNAEVVESYKNDLLLKTNTNEAVELIMFAIKYGYVKF